MSEARESRIKRQISIKVGDGGIEWLDRLAEQHKVRRSDIARAAFAVASRHENEVNQKIKESLS